MSAGLKAWPKSVINGDKFVHPHYDLLRIILFPKVQRVHLKTNPLSERDNISVLKRSTALEQAS